jgi:prepilin-type N-terminal cleavage/methylation domain-containing protein
MNYEQRTNKGFTLIELLVSIGILAIVLSFAGVIFRVCIDSQRTAVANAEIMQKLRAITEQLDADFKGLRKDGEIFIIWMARAKPGADPDDPNAYVRFDRIMFYADGDFQSYRVNPMVRGNVARISYMLANRPPDNPNDDPNRAVQQKPRKRMLARNQHILTADPGVNRFLDPVNYTEQQLYQWNNQYEYEKIFMHEWEVIPWANKADLLSVVCDVAIAQSSVSEQVRGSEIDPANPNTIQMLLCEGVGEFKVQGWSDAQRRWIPEVDPDGDGFLTDTDFIPASGGIGLHSQEVPGVLYPYPPNGIVQINNINYPRDQVDEEHFNMIPGLGRALKFTFTLFDSKGIIKEGRTFTHIVYLDK